MFPEQQQQPNVAHIRIFKNGKVPKEKVLSAGHRVVNMC